MRAGPVGSHDAAAVLVAGACAALVAGVCAGADSPGSASAEPLTLHVSDFGAVGDATCDDGPAIRRALAEAVAHEGPAIVRFDRKTYRLGPWDGRWCALPLIEAEDVTLDGGGALLLVPPKNRALLLLGCRNVVVRDFRIDYDPLPFTQGDVVSVDREGGTFDVRLHAGYPDPPSQAWVEANYASGMGWRHGCFVAPGRRAYTHNWVYVDAVRPVTNGDRRYRVAVRPAHRGKLKSVSPGQRFVFRCRTAGAAWRKKVTVVGTGKEDRGVYHSNGAASIQVRRSLGCALERIDHYLSPNMVVRADGSDGFTVRGLRVTYRPGTDRLTAALSDGIHCKGARVGPRIEGCLFEGLFDDSINISTHAEVVQRRLGETRLRTRYADVAYYDSCLREGDVVLVWDPAGGRPLGEARAARVTFVRSHVREVTLDRPVAGIREADAVGHEDATRLYVRKRRDAEVRDCTFRSQLKTAMLLRDPVRCEGNRVVDCAYGVHVFNSSKFDEGPPPYRAVIRENRFERTTAGAIVMLALSGAGEMTPFGERFLVAGNHIEEAAGPGIRLTNLRNVRVRGNAVRMSQKAAAWAAGLMAGNCAGLVIDGLRVEDARPGSPGAVVLERMPRESVRIRNLVTETAAGVPAVKR